MEQEGCKKHIIFGELSSEMAFSNHACRLAELPVIDICFLQDTDRPTIVVLYQDTRECRHMKTYEIQLSSQELVPGPWQKSNLEMGASLLIPLPKPVGIAYSVGNVN